MQEPPERKKEMAEARTYSIETEQDIDKFPAQMKQKLMSKLEEDTIITLS